MPARTCTRFFERSTTNLKIATFSSSWSVGASPVVPQATIASVPPAIWSSISPSNAFQSIVPPRNGVTIAVLLPSNTVYLLILFFISRTASGNPTASARATIE